MDMQMALASRLLTDPDIAALVGTRVDWIQRKQDDPFPAIVLTTISDPRPQHLKGFEDFRETRVQADCLSLDYGEARGLAELVIDASVGSATIGSIRFLRADIDGPRDLGELLEGKGFVHRQSVDLIIRHGTI